MKKIYIWSILTLIIATFLPGGLCAQENASTYDAGSAIAQRETHVTPAQALNVGYTFMRTGTGTRGGGTHSSEVREQAMQLVYTGQAYDSLTGNTTDCYYVFSLQPKGFVIVAADDRVEPILGYSYDNDFVVMNMPTHVRSWLGNYEQQIQEVAKSNLQAEPATQTKWARLKSGQSMSTRSGDTVVGPLLTTTWDQGQYYNVLCPEDVNGPDGHVYTGCVATAMAQIINYWGYPTHGRGTHSYNVSGLDPGSFIGDVNTTGYGTLYVNYDSATYDYTHMPDALTATSTPQEISAVAQLMYHCGVAINMMYSPSESGANEEDVRSALISYYGFAPTLGYAQRQMYTETTWTDSLRANVDRGEPVFYTGSNLHAFVLDGYKQDGFFHFNFGWSGYGDGWYQISAINPSIDFNDWQTAIMGIRPDSDAHAVICHKKMLVQNVDNFTVTEPIDLYPMRGGSLYQATNEETGVRIDLNLMPEVSADQLVLDIIDFGEEHSVVIYDGINRDSLIRVIETRNLSGGLYEGTLDDTIFQNMASTDFSPLVSTKHGFTIVVYSYGGIPESFQLRVRNMADTTQIDTTTTTNRLYWTDVVTSEPEGYFLDGDTIRIYSAEALAWVSQCIDSVWFSGTNWQYSRHTISIENDIDMDGYLWKPIRTWYGNVNGHGHIIRNIDVSSSGQGGLFSTIYDATISNIHMTTSKANATGDAGSLAGYVHNCQIENCCSEKHSINSGNGAGGGLVGEAYNSQITNCYAYGDVYAQFGYGGLVGYSSNSEITNCVTQNGEGFAWSYQFWPPERRGLITKEVHGGSYSNCFSEISPFAENIIFAQNRIYAFLGEIYNVDLAENLAAFNIAEDTLCVPIADVAVNYTLGDDIDVITALNNMVAEYNSPDLRTWVRDSITHLPVFGGYYEVTCPNVSNITAENIPYNGGCAVVLSWQENGEAQEWQVKCKMIDQQDDSATVFYTNSTFDTIVGLQLGNDYYFYVRPLCGGEDTIGWGQPLRFFVDKTLWIEVVTTQPDGYFDNGHGKITITSPEGLAWLAKIGFDYRQDTISIENDLDMGAYKWTPIGRYEFNGVFEGVFEGNNHCIINLYCNQKNLGENSQMIGLVGQANNALFKNIVIKNGSFTGYTSVGCLVGYAANTVINNCHVINSDAKGTINVGGLGGVIFGEIYNCSSSGFVYADVYEGGLVGLHSGIVQNCYSNCSVKPFGIQTRMYYGGLIGKAIGIVNNCYSIGDVEMGIQDPYYTFGDYYGGISIGYVSDVNISYTYALQSGSLPFLAIFQEGVTFSDTSRMVNNSLQTPVTIAGTTYTDLLSALNAWVDANDTAGIYRHWAADSTGTNDGFPVFATIPCIPVTVNDSITACESYVWNDSVYTQSGDYTQTFTATSGCDSVVTLHLTVNHPVMENVENTACESYSWNDSVYTQSGDYTQTFTAASGCDSVVTLHLTVNQSYSGVVFVSSNESYTWADSLYTASGIYEHTWTTAEGCDSTVSLWLTITKTQYDTTYVEVHDTTYIDVHDTTYVDVYVPVHDTTYVDVYVPVHDTTYIDVHDTTYVNVPYPVHDTTYVNVHDTTYVDVPYPVHDTTYVDVPYPVHDTTYVDVPYPVHDTTYVDVHDTTYLWQYDTTYVDVPYPVHDTTYVDVPYPVHDTTYLWQYDTTYVDVPYPVHDTTYIDVPYPVHDTTYVDVPYPVHDTTYIDVHDTTYLWQYDTTYVDVPYPVHDTTYVDVHDTTYLWQYDTTYVNVPYPVHDTTYVDVHDTTYLWQYDTTYVDVPYPVHDTTFVDVHDTTYLWQYDTTYVDVPYPVHDTTYVDVHDTTYLWQYDTTYVDVPYPVHDTTYIDVHDTTYLWQYDTTYVDVPYPVHDTTYVDVHDTTYLWKYDTTYVDVPYPVHDTTYVDVHDTTYLWKYDTTYVDVPYPIHDTTYLWQYDTTYVDVPYPVHDTTYVDVHDTTYLWQYDTTYVDVPYPVHDTTYVDIHDTTYLWQYDTTYVDVPYPVHDTTYVDVHDTTYLWQYDTTYVDVPYPVHDTTYVDVHDTTYLWQYDTTYVDVPYPVHDTTYVDVHDTTYLWQYDTTYVDVPYPIHDTTYLWQYDTTYVDVPYPVHDTTYVDVHDTTYLWQYDTTYVNVPYPVHDTTYVDVHDTTYLWQYDTTYVDVPYPVHDTTYVDVHDTTYLWQHDTTYVTLHDTTILTLHDTTYIDVPYPVHDTTYVTLTDTIVLNHYDTTYIDVPYPIHDTTYVTLTDTIVLNHYDTTYIDVPYPVHDTTFVTLTDTIILNHYDTTYITLHDTITITEPLTWYSLQVLSEDMDKGVGAGSGQFPEGTDVEIAAIPIEGNRFLQWSDGSESNPRTITLNDNLTLTAMFTTVGVTDLELPSWYVYPEQGAFVVKGTGGHQVSVYDAVGKLLHRYSNAPEILRYSVPAAGSYYIQVDNGAAKKVTVVR